MTFIINALLLAAGVWTLMYYLFPSQRLLISPDLKLFSLIGGVALIAAATKSLLLGFGILMAVTVFGTTIATFMSERGYSRKEIEQWLKTYVPLLLKGLRDFLRETFKR